MAKKVAVITILLVLGAMLATACSSGGSGNSVSIQGLAFKPASVSVTAGTTVTWTNNDSVTHTITSDTGAFNSGNVAPGATYSYKFGQAGTFAYHCSIHTTMQGTVVVKSAGGGGY